MNLFIGVLAGLSLFLYGMSMMSKSLESYAGGRLETILETMTHQKWKAVFMGIVITAIIQSSSALTIILISFVEAKIMKLENAIWVVMGANIGTTVTGQMMAIQVGAFSPFFAFIGVVGLLTVKKRFFNCLSQVCIGLGFLFMGLEILGLALSPLANYPFFVTMMTSLSQPFYAVLFGTCFTAVIQSSSASLGILQILAQQGLVSLEVGAGLVYGFNIGTCMSAYLASLTASDQAKRLTYFHILLNVLGAIFFIGLSGFVPLLDFIVWLAPHSIALQLAHLHTFFNIISTLLALPFDSYLLKGVDYFIYKK